MESNDSIQLIVSKDNTVTKSNRLIEAEYKMTAMEFKVVQTVFSNIQPNSSQHSTFVFPIRQFMDMLGLKGESGYAELERITLNLFKPIQIKVDGETKQLSWFQLVNYNNRKGTITIQVNSFWQEFLYSLENNFTSYKLFNITRLSSSYSPRIYELLKSKINLTSKRILSLKELRAKVGVQDSQYPKYANFKQRVLLPAQKELKAQSDIYFEFKEIKHGRSVSHIEFTIYRNIDKKAVEPIIEREEDIKAMLGLFGLRDAMITVLMDQYTEDRIRKNIEYTKRRVESSDIQNVAAYLKSAIEADYAEAESAKIKKEKENYEEELSLEISSSNRTEDKGAWSGYEPKYFEENLLEIIKLKTRFGTPHNQVLEEVKKNMMDFQKSHEKKEGNLISPNKFSDPLIKQICIETINSFYS